MALDFPNSPTLNQTFTAPNGTIWLWDGVKWTAITSTSPFVGQGNVGRNLLHNPLFNVAQRGAGAFSAAGYTLDRWSMNASLDTVSIRQFAASDTDRAQIGDEAATSLLSNTFTGNAGASAFHEITQMVEGVRRLAGKTVTLSFWAAASTALKLGINATQYFGTGGSPSANVNALVTGLSVTVGGAWSRYSVTIAIPSASGKTLGTNGNDYTQFRICYSCGATNSVFFGNPGVQSGVVNLWGVQLEIGSVATPLEKPDPRYDLSNCQRFYQVGGFEVRAYTLGGDYCAISVPFVVQMRASPTFTQNFTLQTNTTAGGLSVGTFPSPTTHYEVAAQATATGTVIFRGSYTASADL